jgi:hypothetical protein
MKEDYMENNPETSSPPAESAGEAQLNFLQRLIGIYFEPTKTFEDISRKGSWVAMFIVVSILAMASAYVVNLRIDRETRIRQSLEMSPIKLSDQQKETALKAAMEHPPGVMERFGFLAAPIGILIAYALMAAAFLLVFVLMGSGLTFKKTLTTTFWAMGPPGIIFSLVSIVLMYVKDPDKLELDPSMNVASNLGILIADQKAHPVLTSLLSSLDIFSLWNIVLLSIGFAAVSEHKLTTKKAATGVLMLWAIWVLGKAGWKAIF